MINRRTFLRNSLYAVSGAALLPKFGGLYGKNLKGTSITILYTNDTHSRIDPFPENAREFAGLGGIARRSSLVKKIRLEEEHVLLLDAGDVFQGTPWFSVYKGKVDFEMMSEMGYDAMAIGNHEFDLGLEGFAEAAQNANFPFLCANYSVWNTPIESHIERELIKDFNGFRIGLFGLGIQLDGLVDPGLRGKVHSRDPVLSAKRSVENLINFHECDYIICLSHLGYRYDDDRIDDTTLARQVPEIDLIIGGHTHTFLDEPAIIEHSGGMKTVITQMGHSGVRLGRIDLNVADESNKPELSSRYYTVGQES